MGQNVIDKVNMKIFFPVLAFKRRSEVCFVMFQVNKYVLYFIHLKFCADKVKILTKKIVAVNRRILECTEL